MEKFEFNDFLLKTKNGKKFAEVVTDDLIKQNFIYVEDEEYYMNSIDFVRLGPVLLQIYDNWNINATTKFYPSHNLESYFNNVDTSIGNNAKTKTEEMFGPLRLGPKQGIEISLNFMLRDILISALEIKVEDLENKLESLVIENTELWREKILTNPKIKDKWINEYNKNRKQEKPKEKDNEWEREK